MIFFIENIFEMVSIFIYLYEIDCRILCMNVVNIVDRKDYSGMINIDF